MHPYNLEVVRRNIFHELNKMLVALSKDEGDSNEYAAAHRITNQNDMLKYYLQFPLKIRETMAEKLGKSERTLNRIYEDPLRLLNDYETIIQLSHFFSYSFPYAMELFFKNSSELNFKNIKESVIMTEIVEFEKERSVEERRSLARVLHLFLSLKLKTELFVNLNLKLIFNKIYEQEDRYKRILNFIENDKIK